MRLQVGKVPPDPNFNPESGGWRKIKEPNMLVFWICAVPVSIVMFLATSIAIGAVNDPSAKIIVRPGDVTVAKVAATIMIGIGFFVCVLILHEIVHMIAHPRFGLSTDSVLGVWPKAGVCYAFYGGELSRNRFLFIIVLPLLTLTVAPVAWFHISGRVNMWLGFLAAINALGASFDVLVTGMVLRQVPASGTIRNNGWNTYWRPTQESNNRLDTNT